MGRAEGLGGLGGSLGGLRNKRATWTVTMQCISVGTGL